MGAHTDDIELGCGATVARALEAGWTVYYFILSIARESVPPGFEAEVLRREALASASAMGLAGDQVTILDFPVRRFPEHRQAILEELVALRRTRHFDVVLYPAPSDIHQDHAVVSHECTRAFKACSTLLGYELPWNDVGCPAFQPNLFIRVMDHHVQAKMRALAQFETQKAAGRQYMSDEFLLGWARFRGVQAGVGLAEAFQVLRITL